MALITFSPPHTSPDQITRCLQNLLFEVPMPPPGKTLALWATAHIILQRPAPADLPLFQYSMRRLFSMFDARRIVQLVTCALLEQQIILKSTDYELLSLVAECITTLMYPFLWQHVYVPILPSTALHFIEAPVPFIMGLHTDIVVDSPTEVRAGCLVCVVPAMLGGEEVLLGQEWPLFFRLRSTCVSFASRCRDPPFYPI